MNSLLHFYTYCCTHRKFKIHSEMGTKAFGKSKKETATGWTRSSARPKNIPNFGGCFQNVLSSYSHLQCDQKKSPNVYKSCPKMISLEK